MNSKTKVTLTATAMVMVTLIAVVSIIAVFAARTQNFTSNITVRYTASQIAGKVSAKYYIGPNDATGTSMTTTGKEGGATELVFRPGDNQLDPNTLNPLGDIILDVKDKTLNIPDTSWVVFEYCFQNGLGTKVDTDFRATLTFNGVADNIDVYTKSSDTQITNISSISFGSAVDDVKEYKGIIELDRNKEMADEEIVTKYFYVKAAIHNIGSNATFSGNFNWDLKLMTSADKLQFIANDTGYSVSSIDYLVGGDIVIPSTYTGADGVARPVTEIADHAFGRYSSFDSCLIKSVVIPDSITTIGEYAFAGCPLTSVEIPDSVITIGDSAFYESAITSVVIPDSVITIGNYAFMESSLRNVKIGEKVSEIGNQAFQGCPLTGSVVIPDSVITIGSAAFCVTKISSISIGANVSSLIKAQTFYRCDNLNEIILNSQALYDLGKPEETKPSMILFTDTYGFLFSNLQVGTGKVKIWTEIDDGTNRYFNNEWTYYGHFEKSENTEIINGKTYNVYTKTSGR